MDIITGTSGTVTTNNDINENINNNSTINDDDDDDITRDLIPYKTCKEAYEASNKSKGLLLSMAHGVAGCNYDINQEPYKSAKNRRQFIPKADNLSTEIVRRAKALGMKAKTFPQPNGWNNGKKFLWLEKNKIKQEDDIRFLIEEVTDFELLLLAVTN
jgi:hypothetical protein